MGLNKKSVDDINVKGQKVLVRCDFNVPLQDGKITDENRLVAALPTIKKLIADGGKIILCSHLGKPKGEPKPELSLAPVAKRLTELLGQEVKFVPSPVVVDDTVRAAVDAMKDGEVILLENTRYRAEETKNGDEFSKDLASLCDVFVNDAFGTAHRAHCSNVGVTKYVDTAVVGYLMEKEIAFLGNAVENPERPFVAILGGAKVSSKISVINNLLDKVDTLIIGGGMSYTFSKAMGGHIGVSLCEDDYLQYALDMMKKAEEKADILTGMIVCTMRNLETEKNIAMLKEAREFLGNGVVACDLAGDEKAYPTAAFADVFATAKKYGMPYTIHAGECGSREEIRTAIELGTSRIGHGIAMSGDEELKKEVAEKKIGVELCPTSNLQTKAVTDFTNYPFREFYDAGILLSINTDNRTVSDTSCTDEYMRLAEAGMFQEPMCEKIYMASLHSAFADDDTKQVLWKKWMSMFDL